jgi:signal peptidase I
MTTWNEFRKNPIVDLVVTLVVAIGIAFLVQLWVVKPYQVPSASMERTVLIGDRVIAARFLYHLKDPSRGEIIVFHPNGEGEDATLTTSVSSSTFVKRLVGMPGEFIGASGGRTYVCSARAPADPAAPNQTPGCRYLDEPYVSSEQEPFGPTRVPDDRYFMMGDNRADSKDSRAWGPIHRSQIIGRAFTTYWPPTRISVY